MSVLTAALPHDATIRVREEWPLGDRGVARWGTWTRAENEGKHAGQADGDFVYVEHDGRAGGCVTGLGTFDVLVSPISGGRVRAVRRRASAAQDCDERPTTNSIDHLWGSPSEVLDRRTEPLRALDVLVLFTPRALIDVGGSREHLKHCLDTALSAANEAFGAPSVNVTFHRRALVPVPSDDHGESLRTIWRRLREPTSPRFGRLASALVRRTHPDVVLLVTGRRTERCHGYASPSRDGSEPAFAVLPVTELRHGDLTLAHELGHALGLPHSDRRAEIPRSAAEGQARRESPQDIMSVESVARARRVGPVGGR